MNQSSALQSIAASWATPGFSLIVCDPEQSSLFWYQFRLRQGSSTNGAATHKIMNLPANAGDFAQWSGELSQSFLGNSQVYWGVLPAPTTKTQKVRQLVITFLKNYTGPHAIWLVAHEDQVSDFGTCRRTVVASQMSDRKSVV